MGRLNNKRALVTAAGQGIGEAIAKELASSGCHVFLHYHSSAIDIEKFRQSGGIQPVTRIGSASADLCQRESAVDLVAKAVEFLGGLDIVINNAGSLLGRRRLEEVEPEFWQETVELNVSSMMWVTQAALPHLKKAGEASIVNLSSLAGRKGGHGGSLCYSAAKGAVLTWSRALATELAGDGIRVNAVAPGFILGSKFHATFTTAESARETIAGIPLKRAGSTEDVARAVAFLASEYDGFITGATLDINGGVFAC